MMKKFLSMFAPLPFCNIGRNRHSSALNLTDKAINLFTRKSLCGVIALYYQIHGFLPYIQFTVATCTHN